MEINMQRFNKSVARIPARVYSYGAKSPIENAALSDDQIRACHRMRNALVEIERNRGKSIDEAMLKFDPNLALIERKIGKLDAELEELRKTAKAKNAEARTRAATKAIRDEAKLMAAQLHELRGQRIETRQRICGNKKEGIEPDPKWTALVDPIHKRMNEERRRLRKRYVAGGLHWSSYAMAEKAVPVGSYNARFSRFRGDGVIQAQIQGGMGVRQFLAESHGQAGLERYDGHVTKEGVSHRRQLRRKAVMAMRIGSQTENEDGSKSPPKYMRLPVVMHRPLPEDATIKEIKAVRYRVGTKTRHRVQFVMTRADGWQKSDCAERGKVGIDVGWRKAPTGLRVAYWTGDDGRSGELVLPQKMLDQYYSIEAMKSERDVRFNEVMSVFRAWLKINDIPEWLKKKTETAGQWESQNRLAGLIRIWFIEREAERKARREAGQPLYRGNDLALAAMLDELEDWRRWDEPRYNRQEETRERVLGWRNEVYRNFAAVMRREYKAVCLEDISWKKIFMHAAPEDAKYDAGIRLNMQFASPATLQKCLSQSARETIWREPERTTMLHSGCGELSGEIDRAALNHTCAKCGAVFDQDQSASQNLLEGKPGRAILV
jgi:hypothetical protein